MLTADVRKLSPYDRLRYWIEERESIRLKRVAGQPPPWTDDEVLQSYRFTNVRRMDDRVSLWLLDHWYVPHFDHPNVLVACALARFFNQPWTLRVITGSVFGVAAGKVNFADIESNIAAARRDYDGPVFNSAYMVRGARPGGNKIQEVLYDYVKGLQDNPPQLNARSMEKTHRAISERYGFGSFMAGQVTADLRHAKDGYWADAHDWAPMGPGSAKGLNVTMGREPTAKLNQAQFLHELRALRDRLVRDLPPGITSRLEMMDLQNCLCEQWKFTKAVTGIGRPKQLYNGAG